MKIVLRSSSLLFTLLGITLNAPVSKVRELLRRSSAGQVRLGMPIGEVLEEFGERAKVHPERDVVDVYFASHMQRRPDLSLSLSDGAVKSIRVYSRRYKTEAGIGVGDALFSLANAHQVKWLDDRTVENSDLGMRFDIEDDRITSVLIS